ncbi:MAG: TonB-dependent receptor plug domain-containing protein [Tannerella sp.]|jgi:hypothetical protein|nr:TonB-dependent receptor plug domain-containing protein [Tannerella sp.]
MKKFLFFLLTVIPAVSICSQDFKGHVMDAKQRPLKGLKVWRKNTTESVVTDKLGIFIFSQILPTDTLVINVTKKEEAILPIRDLREVSVKLEKKYFLVHDGTKELKIDYRKIPRMNFNSNVLTREQIRQLNASSVYELLNGNISGVKVNNGPYGKQVSLRGSTSMEADTEPLFVVNGTQYESSSEVDRAISVNDIEMIEVQKEGAGYGVRGANGVIVITLIKE